MHLSLYNTVVVCAGMLLDLAVCKAIRVACCWDVPVWAQDATKARGLPAMLASTVQLSL